MMQIEEAVRHYNLGSARTLKRRLAATGLPVGERTQDGRVTARALSALESMLCRPAEEAPPAEAPVETASPIDIAAMAEELRLLRIHVEDLDAVVRQMVDFINALPPAGEVAAAVRPAERPIDTALRILRTLHRGSKAA